MRSVKTTFGNGLYRLVFRSMFLLISILNFGIAYSAVEKKPPLNVVLILTDDQGAHLSRLGTPGIHTPYLDALADDGVLFTNAFAAVASCSPSRSSIMTGMYPHANGHWRNTISPELSDPVGQFGRNSTVVDAVGIHEYIKTLPEILKEAGYYTAITYKFHMSPPWKFPFDVRNPVSSSPSGFKQAIQEVLDKRKSSPFFIMANISPPHRPFGDYARENAKPPNLDSIAVPVFLPDVHEVRKELQAYYSAVQQADACAGAIIETLKANGCYDNTLIIFTSDHGIPFQRAKASAYYAGLHVPFIIKPPNSNESKVSDALISLIDIMPTVLDYIGMDTPTDVQGTPIRQVIERHRRNKMGRKYVFGEYNSHGPSKAEHYPCRMVFDGKYYYIKNLMPDKRYRLPADLRMEEGWGNMTYNATVKSRTTHPLVYNLLRELENGRPREELYDIERDPGQLHNLAGQSRFNVKKAELRKALNDWRAATMDGEDDPSNISTRRVVR